MWLPVWNRRSPPRRPRLLLAAEHAGKTKPPDATVTEAASHVHLEGPSLTPGLWDTSSGAPRSLRGPTSPGSAGSTHQAHRPGAQVQEASQQVEGSQPVHLAQQHLKKG